jgi:DNA-binding NarL/FixJ family response regulator
MPIRVLLADDSFIVRRGLASVIESEPELELVAACEDLDSLLAAVEAHEPDVVLTDIRMPPGNSDEGIRAAERLRQSHPEVGVVLLSQYVEPDYALAFFRHGTERRAYLLKEKVYDPEQLLAAVRTVARGGSMIDPKVTETLVHDRLRHKMSPLSALTEREHEVLSAMARGKDNAAIAKSLFLSVRSVERHINGILAKLGLTEEVEVNRRVKAVLMLLVEEQEGGAGADSA